MGSGTGKPARRQSLEQTGKQGQRATLERARVTRRIWGPCLRKSEVPVTTQLPKDSAGDWEREEAHIELVAWTQKYRHREMRMLQRTCTARQTDFSSFKCSVSAAAGPRRGACPDCRLSGPVPGLLGYFKETQVSKEVVTPSCKKMSSSENSTLLLEGETMSQSKELNILFTETLSHCNNQSEAVMSPALSNPSQFPSSRPPSPATTPSHHSAPTTCQAGPRAARFHSRKGRE